MKRGEKAGHQNHYCEKIHLEILFFKMASSEVVMEINSCRPKHTYIS